jgi:hypothetical protein
VTSTNVEADEERRQDRDPGREGGNSASRAARKRRRRGSRGVAGRHSARPVFDLNARLARLAADRLAASRGLLACAGCPSGNTSQCRRNPRRSRSSCSRAPSAGHSTCYPAQHFLPHGSSPSVAWEHTLRLGLMHLWPLLQHPRPQRGPPRGHFGIQARRARSTGQRQRRALGSPWAAPGRRAEQRRMPG